MLGFTKKNLWILGLIGSTFAFNLSQANYRNYSEIHQRIQNHETGSEAKNIFEQRVNLNPRLKGEIIPLTADEALAILKGNIPETLKTKGVNANLNIFDLDAYIRNRYDRQKYWWNLEQDLMERYAIWPMYSNALGSDGAFEHLQDWQDLDEILFGSNATPVVAPFNDPDSKISGKTTESQSTAKTEKKSGTTIKVTTASSQTQSNSVGDSIGELLEKSSQYLNGIWSGAAGSNPPQNLENAIEQKPLSPEKSENFIFESIVPSAQSNKPEKEVVATVEDIQKIFEGYDKKVLSEIDCQAILSPIQPKVLHYVSVQQQYRDCENFRAVEFSNFIENVKKRGNINADEIYGARIPEVLKTLDDHIFTFLKETETMEKKLKEFSQKICLVYPNGSPCPVQ